ncbi:unnamed protein product [Heligmosomoides polygyrus]|uniref:DUF5658 domain-containing protein n=1 Tax=Heligmosomoides polygyrus TaxID=6339 RepID=A0A183FX90_HELPZ|nr:unnamed protein product [Heligmosomoides polygyrus]
MKAYRVGNYAESVPIVGTKGVSFLVCLFLEGNGSYLLTLRLGLVLKVLFENFSMVMSVWGVIFLGLLGVFFYLQAVTLFPDLHFSEESKEPTLDVMFLLVPGKMVLTFAFRMIESKYSEKAQQCWIAAGLYGVTLILVFWQNKYNTATVF